MSGYGALGSPSRVLLYLISVFGFLELISPEKVKSKVMGGWGKGGGETYSFQKLVASLSIALSAVNCPGTPGTAPVSGACIVLALASVPIGHCWDWNDCAMAKSIV